MQQMIMTSKSNAATDAITMYNWILSMRCHQGNEPKREYKKSQLKWGTKRHFVSAVQFNREKKIFHRTFL